MSAAVAVPVVLLHAFPLNRQVFSEQHRALESAGYRVFTPDLRGYGTNRIDQVPARESLDVLADDLAAFLDEHDIERAVIGGLSLGGYVCLSFLRRYVQRVAGLVLIDTRAGADDESGKLGRRSFADRVEVEGMGWVPDAMLSSLLSDPTPQQADLVRSWILAADPTVVAWTQRAMANREDTTDCLRRFSGPALVIVGMQDVLTPPTMSEAMAVVLSSAKMTCIPQAGHLSSVQQPTLVSDSILDWLSQQALTFAIR